MSKKPGLIQQALGNLAGKPQPSIRTRDAAGYPTPAARRGKKAVMVWTAPEAADLLREISFEKRVSQQVLLREAINLLLKKYGKAEIA